MRCEAQHLCSPTRVSSFTPFYGSIIRHIEKEKNTYRVTEEKMFLTRLRRKRKVPYKQKEHELKHLVV